MSTAERLAQRVLLIGLDGADWAVLRPLMQQGRLPHLVRLLERGLSGSTLALLPTHGPAVWTSIATGKRPHRHGVFAAQRPALGGLVPVDASHRAAHPVWTILSHLGMRTHCVAWPVTQPAEQVNGVCVSDGFAGGVDDGAVWPPELLPGLRSLRLLPQQVQSQTLQEFVGPQAMARPAGDPLLRAAVHMLAEAITVQNVATELLSAEDWDFAAVHYTLIGQASGLFMQCRPPLPAGIPEDLACFGGLVDSAYALQDLMLGRLLDLAGEETAILLVSGHGFATDAARPTGVFHDPIEAEAAWHRAGGICVMAGPPFKRDQLIENVSPFDFTPTILTLLGQPVAEGADGRPLTRALTPQARPTAPKESVISWEERFPLPPTALAFSDAAWKAAEHLIALGHIDRLAEQTPKTADVYLASMFHRAQSLIEAGEHGRAVMLLRFLVSVRPHQRQFRLELFRAAMAAGDLAAARVATAGVTDQQGGPTLQIALATLCLAEHNAADARVHLNCVDLSQCNSDLLAIKGQLHARLRQFRQALEAFDAAIAIDDTNEKAWFGRARMLRALGRVPEAIAAARRTISLRPEFARAHVELAILCKRNGNAAEARTALWRALAIEPGFEAAKRLLARAPFTV